MERKELTKSEIAQITQQTVEDIYRGCVLLKEGQSFTNILELSRVTSINPRSILLSILSGEVIISDGNDRLMQATIIKLNGTTSPSQTLKTIVEPKDSRFRTRIQALIWKEGQRYQRRFQFQPINTSGKPTKNRVDSRVSLEQILRCKILLQPVSSDEKSQNSISINQTVQDKLAWRYQNRTSSGIITEEEATLVRISEKKQNRFLEYLKKISVAPLERPKKIADLTNKAIKTRQPLIIVNWICPPGTPLVYDENSQTFYRRFVGLDPIQSFRNDYRLFPRLAQEKTLISILEEQDIPYRYYKIVADNNPYCLYPRSLDIDGEGQTMAAIRSFSNYVQDQLDQLIGKDKIIVTTMSGLLGPKKFAEMIESYRNLPLEKIASYLPKNWQSVELDVLTKHTRLDPRLFVQLPNLSNQVVRQYAVEGLSLYDKFGDQVILAWNESTRRSKIIDPLRLAKGLDSLPKFFVLYSKEGGKIVNKF